MDNIARYLFCLMMLLMTLLVSMSPLKAAEEVRKTGFEIKVFELTGNTILPAEKLQDTVSPFTGTERTVSDIEKARDALEKLYHEAGYPAVLVNIPEQTLQDGIVKLQVIESKIGSVKVSGNRYFTMERIMRELPSFAPGGILYLPQVQQEIGRVNSNPDIKVEPVITPGKELGTIDVELKVEDHLPLHGYLELNNRSSHDTKELRLNAMVRYDNLWQRGHSIAFQYQTGPEDPEEVQVVGGSYVLPAPWHEDHQIALYAIWSDSDTAFGEGFNIVGNGKIFGMRYVVPLPPYRLYSHNITFGVDYKDFNETTGFATESGDATETPITYLPLSLSYSASLPDEWGVTTFSGLLNLSFRGIVSDEDEFELKRYKGSANYLYALVGVQRSQKLPLGMSLFAKADVQIADQPLIDNEQYNAGGMESVRGYKESEAPGDHAVHGVLEVSFPDPLEKLGIGKWFQMVPFLFYDVAQLTIQDPLPDQDELIKLEGAGAGVRGLLMRNVEYEMDWAIALASTDRTDSSDQRVYFRVKAFF